MEIVYECCCGIDVHKKLIVACLIKGRKQELRQFGTTTGELRNMSSWLLEVGCQMIAMESTGSYWKPLYNIFELTGLDAIVVNASHMKALPGRKTDVKDAEWIADLLRHGLLKASYIPDREQRELREITRYRKSLIEERSREINRLQKMLEGANIKLSGVVKDINGKSSRKLLGKIIADKKLTEDEVKDLIFGSMHKKLDQIMPAIDGIISPLQKRLLASILSHIDDMTNRIKDMDKIIKDYLDAYERAITAIDELPGIGRTSAEAIIAEIGKDMSRFPSAAHICSWAGVCPGNNESAGKRKYGQTTKGNKALKTILVQCAKAAKNVKSSFFSAQYQRIAIRRGKNRATLAIVPLNAYCNISCVKNRNAF
ncbi:MAG: Transposase IS116/IS110/IS902 family protein [Pelotomaculum sp. PtaB.Bin104]|nr:MAG: Transposase IS116/IS110/IS902 family protein [Pelotomaculum sp. PtaB.Bin104]